jgi:agmatinase
MTSEERLPLELGVDGGPVLRSFYGAPFCHDLDALDAQGAFVGIPYDQGAPVGGFRYGPEGMRDARVYRYSAPGQVDGAGAAGYFDIDADRHMLAGVTMADCGDVTIVPADVERNFWRITRTIRTILARGSLPVAVGGDHSVTTPIVRAYESQGPIDIVHFDAHHDYYDHVQGVRSLSATVIRRCAERPWVRRITQVGPRVGGPFREPVDDSRARGNRLITSDQFRALGPDAAMAIGPESEALYVTLDIDVMDPSICPGTGAPEPGGLTYVEMRAAFRALARRGRVLGIDVVEVAPRLDPTGITAKTASRLVMNLLTAIVNEHAAVATAQLR